MRKILEYNEFKDLESETRTKKLTDAEFLDVIRENCKNFSFDNDMLYRKSNSSFGDFGLYLEAERARTIGNYDYKDFFDNRKGYVVPRYKSLIGSTTEAGSDMFGSGYKMFLVIPFDNANIIFAGSPDIALWSKVKQVFSDDIFLLKNYDENFKVPNDELKSILMSSNIASYYEKVKSFGYEFFTNSNCLLLGMDKIDWLKENINK
jgi:hypothetical protein